MSQDFSDKVKAKGLPLDELIVIGSGILDQLNIRRASDIDLVVSASLFKSMSNIKDWQPRYREGQLYYVSEDTELWSDWSDEAGELSYEQLLEFSEVYAGVRYVSLDFIERWKQWRRRPKDLQDLMLISQYRESLT